MLCAGAIGLLATLVLRLRGLEVVTMARTPPPHLKSRLVEDIGATFLSTREVSLEEAAARHGPPDIIFEATGSAAVAFKCAEILGKNGVLILTSITGGKGPLEIPANEINLRFVLDNKLMFGTVNANREYFELGVKDFAHAESEYPGWLSRLLTHPVAGLERYEEMMHLLTTEKQAVKVYVEVMSL